MNKEIFEAVKDLLEKHHAEWEPTGEDYKTDLAKTIAEAVPELETKFLTKHNLKYQLGFCDGRVSFHNTLLTNLRKAAGNENHKNVT